MIDDIIVKLQHLKDELTEAACNPQDPFMKLATGTAPTLNYNLPQNACFSMYGKIPRLINPAYFKSHVFTPPAGNFFAVANDLTETALQQKFAQATQMQTSKSTFVPNAQLLRKHLDPATTNLKAMALNLAPPDSSANMIEKTNVLNEIQLATLAKQGHMPFVVEKLGGFQTKMNFLREPTTPAPYFCIVEEYRTCSYLGDYGAGKTVSTFSLLPGEQTTITIRTYKDRTSSSSKSDSVLDSFSEDSTNDLEHNIEQENGSSSADTASANANSSVTSAHSQSNANSGSVSANGGLDLGIISFGASGGNSWNSTDASSSSATFGYGSSTNSTRAANTKALTSALDKHVESANTNRQVNVNTTTSDTASSGEEDTTVRQLVNYNKSRVLNFVFRQLCQEYITITYLSRIRIAYCNGYAESLRIVDLESLDTLLNDVIDSAHVDEVRTELLKHYCSVWDYTVTPVPFIEPVTVSYGECFGLDPTLNSETFYRVKPGLIGTYTSGGLVIKVPGVILNVKSYILGTPSVVADALLGQGEALDCYNMKVQDAAAINGYLDNLAKVQQIDSLEGITDPIQKTTLYKKIFGPCCDVAQNTNCGCGGSGS